MCTLCNPCSCQLPPCDPPVFCPPSSPPLAINSALFTNITGTNLLRPIIDPIFNRGIISRPNFFDRRTLTLQPRLTNAEPELFIQCLCCENK